MSPSLSCPLHALVLALNGSMMHIGRFFLGGESTTSLSPKQRLFGGWNLQTSLIDELSHKLGIQQTHKQIKAASVVLCGDTGNMFGTLCFGNCLSKIDVRMFPPCGFFLTSFRQQRCGLG